MIPIHHRFDAGEDEGHPNPGRIIDRLAPLEQPVDVALWLIVVGLAALDITLTQLGLQIGFVELNPLGRFGLASFGIWSLFGVKATALAVGFVIWYFLGERRLFVPTIYAICWGTAVLANSVLIVGFF